VVANESRLKLEPAIEPVRSTSPATAEPNRTVQEAIEAVAVAASAARASAASASASAERIDALERSVAQLTRDAKANQAQFEQSRERIQRAEDAARWTWPLAIAVLLLGALAIRQGARLRRTELGRKAEWQSAAGPLPTPGPSSGQPLTAPIPFVTAEIKRPVMHSATRPLEYQPPPERRGHPAAVATRGVSAFSSRSPDLEPESPMVRTELLPPRAAVEEGHPRDVSIEELIDLEQQAEFFVVLGQDDAAVELLNEHLRQTGGGSPLPHLKLLEIHRRRGDRGSYEAIQQRFNQRFNAYAPGWEADLQAGRSLEDYPDVIPRLESVWSRPLNTMAELEALLFRKSRGELFDLPAYREVLFLYALARDLLDRESVGSGDVDLLLPLTLDPIFNSTAPAPFMGLAEAEPQNPPIGAIDFDLSVEVERPSSIFDRLENPAPSRGT
jgi:hypothetical protein